MFSMVFGSLNNPNGETCFFVFHEETNEDYLIGVDELISIANI
ncbi:hypothetical protein ACFVRR_12475 [Gottfriedia sp. NPDC057948]